MRKYRSGALALGVGATVGLLASAVDAALVGQWTFNESTGNAVDSSPNGYTGTLSSTGATLPGRGNDGTRRYVHFEQALQQFVDMGDAPNLRINDGTTSTGVTVMGWVRYPSNAVATFGGEPGIGKPFRYGLTQYSNGNTYGYIASGGQSVTGNTPEDAWHHVAMTYDNLNDLKMYIDGALVATNPIGANKVPDTSGYPFRIARSLDNVGANSFFTGDVDEVRVYNEALDATAVATAYNGGAAPNPLSAPGSVRGLWSLNDASFADSSGRNNHLTNSGGVTIVPGKIGNAAQFNGPSVGASDDKLYVFSDDFRGPFTSFSNGAWIKIQGAGSDAGIIGDGSGDLPYDLTVHNGNIVYAYVDDGGNNVNTINTGLPANPDGWIHVAHTFDGTTHRLYIDGVNVASDATNPATTGGDGSPFQLGYVSSEFTGIIDEAFFTTEALSETQIQAYMNGVPEPTSALALGTIAGLALLRRRQR